VEQDTSPKEPRERFTRREVLRILDLPERQLNYWERLRLICPRTRWGEKFYTFTDLISLRTIKQLTHPLQGTGVPARRLRRALEALERQLAEVTAPLTELRIVSDGRAVAVEVQGTTLEPLSGQCRFDFETRTLKEKVRVMPERTAEEWFALALDCEGDPDRRSQAIDAYRRVLERAPHWVEPHINLGTLLYEAGEPAQAVECYREAVGLDPQNPLAHFNLGSVLDELGQGRAAREHLRHAVGLKPDYADAHYNLALTCERLGDRAEAARHWKRYLELDPESPWADYARQRLIQSTRRDHP
jgi:tetratricopeptide (TPR) repeat protein